MDTKATLKVWVTVDNMKLIQKGSNPSEFETVPPSNLSNYVELSIDVKTLTEWVEKAKPKERKKNFLFG